MNQVGKAVLGLEVGIDLNSPYAGKYEGAWITRLKSIDGNTWIDRVGSIGSRESHRLLVPYRTNHVIQLGVSTDLPLQGSLEKMKEGSLKILAEEVRRNFQCQC